MKQSCQHFSSRCLKKLWFIILNILLEVNSIPLMIGVWWKLYEKKSK